MLLALLIQITYAAEQVSEAVQELTSEGGLERYKQRAIVAATATATAATQFAEQAKAFAGARV